MVVTDRVPEREAELQLVALTLGELVVDCVPEMQDVMEGVWVTEAQ